MILKKNHTNLSRNNRRTGLKPLLWGVGVMLLALLAYGIYSMVLRTALRVSPDYYFPFLRSAQAVENTIADQTLLAQSKYTLARALRNMMTENAALSAERAIVTDLKKENAELRALLGLGRKGTFRPVFAEVIARDPMTWQEEFTISKGSRDGIGPGDLVVISTFSGRADTPKVAVIGRVKEVPDKVSAHTAHVSTILSRDFRLSVSLPATRSSGILEGARQRSDQYATLTFMPRGLQPAPGQLVYTNSFSGNSPPGLPVGRIVSPGAAPVPQGNRLYLETGVQPFASPAEIRFVAVYVKEKP